MFDYHSCTTDNTKTYMYNRRKGVYYMRCTRVFDKEILEPHTLSTSASIVALFLNEIQRPMCECEPNVFVCVHVCLH